MSQQPDFFKGPHADRRDLERVRRAVIARRSDERSYRRMLTIQRMAANQGKRPILFIRAAELRRIANTDAGWPDFSLLMRRTRMTPGA
jgi:hypothetical protein